MSSAQTEVSNNLVDRPSPVISPETRPYWKAAERGALLIQRCNNCSRLQFPYRQTCCNCWKQGFLEDVECTGAATVWTFSVIYRNDTPGFAASLPYVSALVELEEGLRMMTNIIN